MIFLWMIKFIILKKFIFIKFIYKFEINLIKVFIVCFLEIGRYFKFIFGRINGKEYLRKCWRRNSGICLLNSKMYYDIKILYKLYIELLLESSLEIVFISI